jgi:hypothetical protein
MASSTSSSSLLSSPQGTTSDAFTKLKLMKDDMSTSVKSFKEDATMSAKSFHSDVTQLKVDDISNATGAAMGAAATFYTGSICCCRASMLK